MTRPLSAPIALGRARAAACLALLAALSWAPSASAQLAVGVDLSGGPSLSVLGTGGTVTLQGVPVPLGRVDYPTAVGLDLRARLSVRSGVWGVRLGAGYLSASDVFDGASLFNQEGVTLQFAVATLELTATQPVGALGLPAVLVVGLGPELRALVSERSPESGLGRYLGDVGEGHVAVGASVALLVPVGAGVALGPELRGGYALGPFSDDTIDVLGGVARLDGDFRFHHLSGGLTVAF